MNWPALDRVAENTSMSAQLNFDETLKQNGFFLDVNSSRVPVCFRDSLRARHYAIYVRRDGNVTVTIPRRGSFKGAQRFLKAVAPGSPAPCNGCKAGQWRRSSGKWEPKCSAVAGQFRFESKCVTISSPFILRTNSAAWLEVEIIFDR